jgi:hypothetical protein
MGLWGNGLMDPGTRAPLNPLFHYPVMWLPHPSVRLS